MSTHDRTEQRGESERIGPPGAAALDTGRYSGTVVYYAALCGRKLWWFTHGLEQESGSDLVAQGRNLQERSYSERRKEVEISGALRVDGIDVVTRDGGTTTITIHEVKRSRTGYHAQRMQLLHYMRTLRSLGMSSVRGVLEYPQQRRRVEVLLTPESESELDVLLSQIDEVRKAEAPPVVADRAGFCENCAYDDLCWG